jgi:hypothetical protein
MSKRKNTEVDFDTALAVAARDQAAAFGKLTHAEPETPDPLAEVDYTGDQEQDCKAELTALQAAFRERKANEARRFEIATDTEYWCALVFQTRDQKEAFLQALGLLPYGDKYLDGALVAEKMGIPLPAERPAYNISHKIDPKWAGLVGKG